NLGNEDVALTGGVSNNTFTLSNFSGNATLDGGDGADSASLNLTGGSVTALDVLTLSSNVTINSSADPSVIDGAWALSTARTVTVADGAATDDLVIDGTLSGAGSLIKAGAGTMVVNGANNYTGSTTQSAGTMVVNGSIQGSGLSETGGVLA